MNTPSAKQANPYAPPQAEVRDTVAQGDYELAGRGDRLGAALLDGLIGIVVVGAPLFIGADFDKLGAGNYAEAFSGLGGGLALLGILVLLGVTTYLVQKNGQTIGKKVVGIKVVRSDFSRATLGRIFWLRNFANGIPGVIPYVGNVYGLVDHLFIFFGDNRQCVHDKIADTVVVKA